MDENEEWTEWNKLCCGEESKKLDEHGTKQSGKNRKEKLSERFAALQK
jgi:hypothetical protein